MCAHLLSFPCRNEQEASLYIDDGPPVIGVAPGKLRQLNINDGLYIGMEQLPTQFPLNRSNFRRHSYTYVCV